MKTTNRGFLLISVGPIQRLVSILCLSFVLIDLSGQSLTLSQSVSNTNPGTDDPFEFIISVSCNSTTSNCNNAIVSGFLPEELDFLSFSDPLPIGVASATYDIATRYYELTFNDAPSNSLGQGSTIQFSLQVIFPGGSLSGISATNTVNATSINATGASVSTTVNLGPDGWQNTPGDFPDWKNGDSDQLQGGYQYWQIEIGNIGFSDIDNYQVFDAIPSIVTLDQVRTPEIPFINHLGQLYYKRSDDAVTWYLWINFNLINRTTVNVSGLGLPVGVSVSDVRLDLGTVPASPLYNTDRYSDGFNTDLILYGIIDSPLADGVTFTNCADYLGTSLSVPISDQDCITTTINSSIAIDQVAGNLDFADDSGAYTTQANIGDTIKANFIYYNAPEMINDIYGGVMSIVLPPGMSYIPNTLIEEWPCSHFDGQTPVIETGTTVDGREIVRFIYDASLLNEFIIEANGDWDGCGFYFDVVVGNSTIEGNNRGYYYFNATGSTHAECTTVDTENYLNGYAPNYCYEEYEDILIVRPPGSAGVRAEKEVIGTLDGSYSQYPATGTTVPGGLSNYRITLTNPNTTPINNIEIIDILPYLGDTDVLNTSTPRFSQWRPNLAAPITPPAGVSVLYTTVTNPCRDELAGANPTPYPTGCNTPSWNAVAPTDITDVTALKFDLFGITLNQNDDIVLEFDMRAPVNAPTGGEVSWNSFAYVAENASTSTPLLPTEAIKVGIETIPGTVPIGGDFVWDDLNGNGLQDFGEPGIDGVRVALIEDSNGNGSYNGGDAEYTWTISANGGQYIFSDFPVGDYFIQFSNFPTGYVETHQDIGSDENLDSDGATTDLIVFNNTTDNRDIDFGLYNGTLPALWACGTGLLTNEEFEAGLTDWVDWGNLFQTNDAYVNTRAALINGGEGGFGQVVNVTPGETYRVSFYAKNTGPEEASGGINVKDVNDLTISSVGRSVFENVYEFHSATITMPPNADHIEVWGYKNAGSGAAYFDAFCLELLNDACDGDLLCGVTDISSNWPTNVYTHTENNIDGTGINITTTMTGETAQLDYVGGGIFNGVSGVEIYTNGFTGPGLNIDYNFSQPVDLASFSIGHINYTGTGDILTVTATDGLGNPATITVKAVDYDNDGIFSFNIVGNGSTSVVIDANSNASVDNAILSIGDEDGISSLSIVWDDCTICFSGYHGISISEMAFCYNSTSTSIDTDNDGRYNSCDIDDDNDGIRDIDESLCNDNLQTMVMWSHNTPANTRIAENYQTSWIASTSQENYGSGLGAFLDITLVKMTGVDQLNLAGAVADNDYLEYSLTTQANIDALYLDRFGLTKHGLTTSAVSGNYGYDFSIMVSNDGFATSTLISDIYTVDNNIDPSWTSLYQESDDNFYYLEPSTTYTFRVYFYNKTTSASIEAWYDDFNVIAQLCDSGLDTDGDSYINSIDLDSDNDGLTDLQEAGHNGADANNDGLIDGATTGSGNNGLFDGVESIADVGTYNYILSDSEDTPDGIYDPYELDSDDDGCFDAREESISDPDNDGLVGNGTPTVLSTGLVSGHTYGPAPNNQWQDASQVSCAFVCASGIYMASSTSSSVPSQLYTVETDATPFTLGTVGTYAGSNYNAMGYRTQDNFLYAIELQTNNLVRIDSGGIEYDMGPVTGLPNPSGLSSSYDGGDVFPDGYLYIHEVGSNDEMYQIDVTSSPPVLVATHTLSQNIWLSDFAYNVVDDKVYGVGDQGEKFMIDPTTWNVTTVGTNAPAASYGAAYTDDLGHVYVYRNNPGAFFRVNFGLNGTGTGTMTLISTAPSVSFNDGASCRGTIDLPLNCGTATLNPHVMYYRPKN